MKLKLLFAAIIVCLVSCSSDDNNSSEPVSLPTKELASVTATSYDVSGVIVATTTRIYDKDKPVSVAVVADDTEFNELAEFSYYSNGLLSGYKEYNMNHQLSHEYKVTYDESGRLTSTYSKDYLTGNAPESVTNFTYNTDNSITAFTTDTENGNEESHYTITYFINAAGLIYKKNDDIFDSEAVYEGMNIMNVTYLNIDNTITFSYDTVREMKSGYFKENINQYGGFNNCILAGTFQSVLGCGDKYPLSRNDSNGSGVTYDYVFDTDGYPVKVTSITNDGHKVVSDIVYK